jgi:hypothetical protein
MISIFASSDFNLLCIMLIVTAIFVPTKRPGTRTGKRQLILYLATNYNLKEETAG